jgi:predicted nuclease with TOPRIM domain
MQITSETLNVFSVIIQTLAIIGGTVFGIRKWMTEPLREEIGRTKQEMGELKSEASQRFEKVQQEIRDLDNRIRSMEIDLPKSYIRFDQFLSLNNKLEANLDKRLEELKGSIESLRDDVKGIQNILMGGQSNERRTN